MTEFSDKRGKYNNLGVNLLLIVGRELHQNSKDPCIVEVMPQYKKPSGFLSKC